MAGLSWADHRRMEEEAAVAPRSEFVPLPGGGLLLRGGKAVAEQAPGFFAGLARLIPERFRRKEPPVDQYWIPPAPPVAPAPVVPTLPAYNAWNEIEGEVEREARIARELGEFSKRVLADERLVGKEK